MITALLIYIAIGLAIAYGVLRAARTSKKIQEGARLEIARLDASGPLGWPLLALVCALFWPAMLIVAHRQSNDTQE